VLFLTFFTVFFLSIDRELLDYLASKNMTSTFFVIGSRIVERPQVLVEEYMSGHEIAVHTWSHRVRLVKSLLRLWLIAQ
jgi:peptidoglycan/xylan/chitin deacetylase (PgdA/CDA1 family)